MHSDTLVKTRIKKKLALAIPCLVMLKGKVNILRVNNGSPGVSILKKLGRQINRENKGIKIHVRFKKKPKCIEENTASKRQNAYIPSRKQMFFEKRTARSKSRILRSLIRGSRACKKPCLAAHSSENIDSNRNERVPLRERSIKLPVFIIISAPPRQGPYILRDAPPCLCILRAGRPRHYTFTE